MAALVVLGVSGTWLGQKLHPAWTPFGLIVTDEAARLNFAKTFRSINQSGIAKDGAVALAEIDFGYLGILNIPRASILEVNKKGDFNPAGFWASRWDEKSVSGSVSDCGDLGNDTVVNFVRIDAQFAGASTMFSERVFIPSYYIYQSDEFERIYAFVVDADENGDGKLGCDDTASFKRIDALTGQISDLGLRFKPTDVAWVRDDLANRLDGGAGDAEDARPDGLTAAFVVGSAEGKGAVLHVVNVRDGAIRKRVLPDFLSGAREALQRTNND
ncbi:MAG: hypothetical protein AAGC56_06080 [Pseudomonadota bacterium]